MYYHRLPSEVTKNVIEKFDFNFESLMTCYADDINHIISHKDYKILEDICNTSIKLVQNYITEKQLVLNNTKTNFLNFKSVYNKFEINNQPNLVINDMNITSPEVVSFLGLKLNQHLDWSDHIDYLSNSIRKGVYMLGRLRDEVEYSVLRTVYFAHVYSHIKNNVIFWGHCSSAKRIFILQKFALRTIFKVPKRTSCHDLFREMEVLTVPSIYVYESILFVKKNLHLFEKNCDVHSYATRNSKKLKHIQHSKAFLEKGPKYRLIHLYNKLPLKVQNIENYKVFKKTVYKILLNLNLYSVNDFLIDWQGL